MTYHAGQMRGWTDEAYIDFNNCMPDKGLRKEGVRWFQNSYEDLVNPRKQKVESVLARVGILI